MHTRAMMNLSQPLNFNACSKVSKAYKIAQKQQLIPRLASQNLKTQRIVTAAAADDKPEWLKLLEEDAVDDPDVAALLKGANNNPEEVQRRMKQEMNALHDRITRSGASGVEKPVQVQFKPHDPFACWIWIQLYGPASPSEEEMIQEVIGSWFLLGRLGAFDSGNLQVMYSESLQGEMEYEAREGLPATMHDVGEVESNGEWLRFWVDLGTSDELSLDILINALCTLSTEHVGIRKLVIGGDNEDWPAPDREEFNDEALAAIMGQLRGVDDGGDGEKLEDDDGFGI